MTALAFIIGLLIGLIIGYIRGKQSSPKSIGTHLADHNLSDNEITKINDDLLLDGGKFQVNIESGETIRYISFIDALLMDLNQSNKHLILDHCKNLDSAIRILEQAQRDKDPKFTGFTSAQKKEIEKQVENCIPFDFVQFSKICPPPDKPPKKEINEALLWGPTAMKVVANSTPKIDVKISIKDPNGKILEVKRDGVVYDFGDLVVNNNQTGVHTITFKIRDLELGKTANFEQQFLYKAVN